MLSGASRTRERVSLQHSGHLVGGVTGSGENAIGCGGADGG